VNYRFRSVVLRIAAMLLVLALAACTTQPTFQSLLNHPSPTAVLPVYVYAQCTLMGGAQRTEIDAGRPLTILWGWVAATQDEMKSYIQSTEITVRLDNEPLAGSMRGDAQYDETANEFRAIWSAAAGILPAGTHTLTYQAVFSSQVSDGTSTYGPGTIRETLSDRCEIVVR